MKAGFSPTKNHEFMDAVLSQDLLDVAVVWISDNLLPDDVFEGKILDEWAENNGYVLKD